MVGVVSLGDIPHYRMLFDLPTLENRWVREHAVQRKYEPGTIRSYLLSLGHFMDFLIRSKVTPNVGNVLPVTQLDLETIKVCRDEDSKWRQALRQEEEERQFAVMMEDGDNIIPQGE